MNKNFTRIALAVASLFAAITTTQQATAQISENFNTRPGATNFTEVRNVLVGQGWTFFGMGASGTTIEGDISLQSSQLTGGVTQNAGLNTPLVTVSGGSLTVGFQYRLSASNGTRRWMLVELRDGNGALVQSLDSLELGINSGLHTYNQTFSITNGDYRVAVRFKGTGGNSRVISDAYTVSGGTLTYPEGNRAPVTQADNFTGLPNRTASGNVLNNDEELDGDNMTATIAQGVDPSIGTLVLNANGSFTFTPNPSFTGSGVAFTYIACDDSYATLCSAPTQVFLNFPVGAITPVMMLDFTATHQNGLVTLFWSTATELNNAKFEVMRSTNGTQFEKVGEVAGRGTVTSITNYNYQDAVQQVNAPVLYYKLRQVDIDGKSEFTKTVVVRLQTQNIQLASIAPNPVQGQARLTLQLEKRAPVMVRILDQSGKELARKSYQGQAGTNAYTIEETASLNKGMYLVEILVDGKERSLIKILK